MGRTVWFPGHMARGQKKLSEVITNLDALIELRDARAPQLTASPHSDQLSRMKPVIVVLSRRDLAEEPKTAKWLEHFRKNGIPALAYNLRQDRFEQLKGELSRYKPFGGGFPRHIGRPDRCQGRSGAFLAGMQPG